MRFTANPMLMQQPVDQRDWSAWGREMDRVLTGGYFARTAAEVAAGVVPTDYSYAPGDIRRYGGKVDGATDDTSAWTAAIGQASAGGVPATMPPGVSIVNINSALNVFTLDNELVVAGQGMGCSEIRTTGTPTADRTLFYVSASESATIRDLKITGPSSDGAGFSKGIRHAGTAGTLRVERCAISAFMDGIKKDAGASCVVYIDGCDIRSCRSQGFLNVGDAGSAYVTRTKFASIGTTSLHHGIYHQAPFTEIIVSDCSFSGMSGYGVHCYGGTPVGGRMVVSGCTGYSNTSGDVFLDDALGVGYFDWSLTGNVFNSANGIVLWGSNGAITGNAFNCSAIGVSMTNGKSRDVTISGNNFINGRAAGAGIGIDVASSDNVRITISGNTFNQVFAANGSQIIRIAGGTDISVNGNTFRLQGGYVRVRDSANKVSFRGNRFTGTTNTVGGIYVVSTATDPIECLIEDNDILTTDRALTVEVTGVTYRNNRQTSTTSLSASKYFRRAENNDGDTRALPTIASAATVNLIGWDRGLVQVTGTTNVDTLNIQDGAANNLQKSGELITLTFSGVLTVGDATGNIKLAGNFVTTADDTLTLRFDGTNWLEVSRSAN